MIIKEVQEAAIETYWHTLIAPQAPHMFALLTIKDEQILALTQTTPMDGLVQQCLDGKELRFSFFAPSDSPYLVCPEKILHITIFLV